MAAVGLVGVQEPAIRTPPAGDGWIGDFVVEWCGRFGLDLDPWQQLWLQEGLVEAYEGKWAAFEVATVVSRQNGKGEVLMARELAGLFLLGERLILHSAHEFKTCLEAFRRTAALVEASPLLRREVALIRTGKGDESIELRNGARLRFLARSTSSGRGFTGDLIVLDEAQILGDGPMLALMPTLSTRANPQIWYAGTAGNQRSTQLGSLRRRALSGDPGDLVYLEWSSDDAFPPDDPRSWAQANPAMGIRIGEDYIRREFEALSGEGFAAERLGKGDWPVTEILDQPVTAEQWNACLDRDGPQPTPEDCAVGIDINLGHTRAVIAVAGERDDGRTVVEVVADLVGPVDARQIYATLETIADQYFPSASAIDGSGPAQSLTAGHADRMAEVGIMPGNVLIASGVDTAGACMGFANLVAGRELRHRGGVLTDAIRGARWHDTGQYRTFGRRDSTADISPLVASAMAVWALRSFSTGTPYVG